MPARNLLSTMRFTIMDAETAEAYLRGGPRRFIGGWRGNFDNTAWGWIETYREGVFVFQCSRSGICDRIRYSEFNDCGSILFCPVDEVGKFIAAETGPKQMSLMEET